MDEKGITVYVSVSGLADAEAAKAVVELVNGPTLIDEKELGPCVASDVATEEPALKKEGGKEDEVYPNQSPRAAPTSPWPRWETRIGL